MYTSCQMIRGNAKYVRKKSTDCIGIENTSTLILTQHFHSAS